MAGDGAAGISFVNGFEVAVGIHSVLNCGILIIGNHGLGDKDLGAVNIFPLGDLVLNVGRQGLDESAAVFLANAHLAVADLNAGLQVQQIGTESRGGGAAAALDQVIQLVDQEAGLDLGGKCIQLCLKCIQIRCGLRQTAGLQNNQALTGGQILGVNSTDVVKLLSCKAGILVGGREAGSEIDVDNAVILL